MMIKGQALIHGPLNHITNLAHIHQHVPTIKATPMNSKQSRMDSQ